MAFKGVSTLRPYITEMYTTWGMTAAAGGGDDVDMTAVHEHRVKARLNLFFDVVGTPSWHDVAAVSCDRWRRYLRGIRGRPGSLMKQFSGCDEASRDLLLRMLTFDPGRRAGPDEILAHEYFLEDHHRPAAYPPSPMRVKVGGEKKMWDGDRGNGVGTAEDQEEEEEEEVRMGKPSEEEEEDVAAMDVSAATAAAAAAAVAAGTAAAADEQGVREVNVDEDRPKMFWELAEPRLALSALEAEFAAAAAAASASPVSNTSGTGGAWRDHFRAMFERECERQTRSGDDFDDLDAVPTSDDFSQPASLHAVRGPSHGAACVSSRVSADSRVADLWWRSVHDDDEDEDPRVRPGGLNAMFPLFFRAGEMPLMYTGSDRTRWSGGGDTARADQIALESRYLGGAPGTTGVYGQGGTGVGTRKLPLAGSSGHPLSGKVGTALGHLSENRHGEWLEYARSLPSSQRGDVPKGVTFGGEEGARSTPGAAAVWGVSAVPPGVSKEEGDLYRSMNDQQSR